MKCSGSPDAFRKRRFMTDDKQKGTPIQPLGHLRLERPIFMTAIEEEKTVKMAHLALLDTWVRLPP